MCVVSFRWPILKLMALLAELNGNGRHGVQASEIDTKAVWEFRANWSHDIRRDLDREANEDMRTVPAFDVLPAGFT
jgi:hypothetical protein